MRCVLIWGQTQQVTSSQSPLTPPLPVWGDLHRPARPHQGGRGKQTPAEPQSRQQDGCCGPFIKKGTGLEALATAKRDKNEERKGYGNSESLSENVTPPSSSSYSSSVCAQLTASARTSWRHTKVFLFFPQTNTCCCERKTAATQPTAGWGGKKMDPYISLSEKLNFAGRGPVTRTEINWEGLGGLWM